MGVLEVVRKRRSIRRYRTEPVASEDLKKMLEAARLAPSAGNRQPWYFIVVRDAEIKRKLAEAAAHQMFIADADVIVVGVSDPRRSPRWHDRDLMIAMEHLILEATELGYGTCWIGAFNEDRVKEILEIPEEYRVVALTPVGVPDESPPPRPRRSLEEIVFQDKWGSKTKF
ncbi:MAG: nitroreductase [Thermoprotei archaeon]|nr:MAG: nitroreductase [Thermoprotei archaeon]